MTDFESLRQHRASGHPSDRDLEAIAFGAEEKNQRFLEARRHLEAGCRSCEGRLQALRQERSAFLARRPVKPFVAQISKRAPVPFWKRRLFIGGVGAALVAASLAFFVVLPGFPPRGVDDAPIRLKGTLPLRLEVLVSRDGGAAVPLVPGAALQEGDILRFHVTAPAGGFVFIANIDEQGRVERYFPTSDEMKGRVMAGPQVLPGSVVLDGYLGEERITLFWSQEPLSNEEVRRALEAAFRKAGGLPRGPLELPGESSSVLIRKAAR